MAGQNPTDIDGLLKDFDDLDLEGAIPEEIQNLSEDSDDESKKKAAVAFAQQRGTLRTAKDFIVQQDKELKELRKGPKPPTGAPAPVDASGQSTLYVGQLQQRAMQATQIFDPTNPLVQLEVQRQYGLDAEVAAQTLKAEGNAATIIEGTLGEFEYLDDDDKATIKEAVSKRSVLDQADPEVVKSEVHRHVGENISKFSGKIKPPAQPTPNGKKPAGGVTPGAVAASSVRSKGSTGVAPANPPPGGEIEVKPATDKERKRMRIVGADPTDLASVARFRTAETKAGSYSKS